MNKQQDMLFNIRSGKKMTKRQQLSLVIRLSTPAILAQISSIAMQYIDASMVGHLGAEAAASIGLVSSSTWFFGGLCFAGSAGFSVQVAQALGAGKEADARNILRQALIVDVIFCLILMGAGLGISPFLPDWLGANAEIRRDAFWYFFIYMCSIPAIQMNCLAGDMLRCSGNMRAPSILNISMCIMDVIFNVFFIFPGKEITLLGESIYMPGMGLGVMGAALGTAMAQLVTAGLMMWMLYGRSPVLRLKNGGSWRIRRECLRNAARIALPMGAERVIFCGAMIVTTKIVSPLGTISIAANSLAVTAESFCYMPGYGIEEAATTLVGQSVGAGRKELTRSFARMSVYLAMGIMTCTGFLMFFLAPEIFKMMTSDLKVQELGIKILRIEAFAEPMFAASIASSGALRGAGDTLIPSVLNLISIWGVRLTLSFVLVGSFGLVGVWIAMCVELICRGVLFLIRLYREKWMKPLGAI